MIDTPMLQVSRGDALQELIEARKEERKRKRAEGKGRAGAAAWEEEVKLEGADSGLGDLENGDGPDHRSVQWHTDTSKARTLQVLLGLRPAGHVTILSQGELMVLGTL